MSSSTITVLRCDRCDHSAEMRQPADRIGWGRIAAAAIGGDRPREIGADDRHDLCPGCADALFAWWRSEEPIAQPLPPPPPAPRALTIEDRAIAHDHARRALREQVEETCAAAREAPTSLLGGQLFPGGMRGADDRARLLVDRLFELVAARGLIRDEEKAA